MLLNFIIISIKKWACFNFIPVINREEKCDKEKIKKIETLISFLGGGL